MSRGDRPVVVKPRCELDARFKADHGRMQMHGRRRPACSDHDFTLKPKADVSRKPTLAYRNSDTNREIMLHVMFVASTIVIFVFTTIPHSFRETLRGACSAGRRTALTKYERSLLGRPNDRYWRQAERPLLVEPRCQRPSRPRSPCRRPRRDRR